MYAFMQKQQTLERVFWNKTNFHLAILNKVINSPKVFMLLRSPEARFISYFKDKFRQEPSRMLKEGRLQPNHLQQCQRLWLKHIGAPLNDVEACCHELIKTPIDEIVEWLPRSYKEDSHTIPQYYSLFASWRGISIRLNIEKAFLIDRDDHLQLFSQLTKIDISQKVNSTKKYLLKSFFRHHQRQ